MPLFDNPLTIPLAGEAAGALGYAGRRLRKTLDALRNYDLHTQAHQRPVAAADRSALVAEAGDALWSYIVQREILGLHDADYICHEYQVPDEVRRSMAPRRRPPP
jgi:hypothetical protein